VESDDDDNCLRIPLDLLLESRVFLPRLGQRPPDLIQILGIRPSPLPAAVRLPALTLPTKSPECGHFKRLDGFKLGNIRVVESVCLLRCYHLQPIKARVMPYRRLLSSHSRLPLPTSP
jgi:hypothetical protein